MTSDPNAYSSEPGAPVMLSDLDRARAASQRLRSRRDRNAGARPAPPPSPAAAPPPEPRRTSASAVQTEAAAEVELVAEERGSAASDDDALCEVELAADAWLDGNLGSRFWNDLLSQCLEIAAEAGARSAFAVDEQGLGIAQTDELAGADVDATGSRLVIALEQAEAMEPFAGLRPQAMLIDFGSAWLTGLPISYARDHRVVLGVIGGEPLSPTARERIAGLAAELIARAS